MSMNRKVHKSLPPSASALLATKQKGAFVDTSKGMTTIKSGHFDNKNQELCFAKYYSKFESTEKGKNISIRQDWMQYSKRSYKPNSPRFPYGSIDIVIYS